MSAFRANGVWRISRPISERDAYCRQACTTQRTHDLNRPRTFTERLLRRLNGVRP